MEIVIVERVMEEPLTLEAYKVARESNPDCFTMRRVRFLTSYLSADGLRCICVYEAPDAAAVREANEQAGDPFVRVWTGTQLT